MASSFRVTISRNDLPDIEGTAKRLGHAMEIVIRRVLSQAEREIALQIKPGRSLNPRSGGLAKSWTVRGGAELVISQAGEAKVSGRLGSNHPAARIQEEGGTVRATRAKNLAIPLDAAKTAAGVARWASPRQVPDLFYVKTRAGKEFLARKRGDGIEPFFKLQPSAELDASRYLTNAAAATSEKSTGIAEAVMRETFPKVVA